PQARRPRARSACRRAVEARVLPTPVSVPVTNRVIVAMLPIVEENAAPSGGASFAVGVGKAASFGGTPPSAAAGGGCPAGKVRVLLPIRPPAIHGRLRASPSCIHGRHEPPSRSGGKKRRDILILQ